MEPMGRGLGIQGVGVGGFRIYNAALGFKGLGFRAYRV